MVDMKHTVFRDNDQKLQQMNMAGTDAGITVDPMPITAGQQVTILYNGLLADSGADQVYLHMGYGLSNIWNNVQTVRMSHTGYGWEKSVSVTDTSRLNICFKDSANNWDNNNGVNWSFEIHNGEQW